METDSHKRELNRTEVSSAAQLASVAMQNTTASRRLSAESQNRRGPSHQLPFGLTGLSIEQTGLVSRDVEVGIFLVDFFVAVDPVLLRVIPHGVVPPIEQRLGLGLINRIPVGAARILLHQPGRDIVNVAISAKRIQHDEETGLMVVQLIDTSGEIRLGGK